MSLICSSCSKDMSKKGFFLSPQDLPHKTFPDFCGACGYQKEGQIKAVQRKERSEAEAVEREREERKRLEIQSKKLRITEALERIDNKTYGNCEECGAPIGKARLQVFPRATLCMLCKQKEERR